MAAVKTPHTVSLHPLTCSSSWTQSFFVVFTVSFSAVVNACANHPLPCSGGHMVGHGRQVDERWQSQVWREPRVTLRFSDKLRWNLLVTPNHKIRSRYFVPSPKNDRVIKKSSKPGTGWRSSCSHGIERLGRGPACLRHIPVHFLPEQCCPDTPFTLAFTFTTIGNTSYRRISSLALR